MQYRNTSATAPMWNASGHASLCLLGVHLRRMNFFQPLEAHVKIEQKVLKYTSVQKLEMFLVGVLAGAKAVSHTDIAVRLDPALISAFGLPGCAEQSSIADTLNAATERDVADLQAALGELFGSYSQSRQHDFTRDFLVLDVDLSPEPLSNHAEGSERGYMGRSRSKTGRKLVRVRAADTAADRVGNGHHGPQGRESADLARSDRRDGEPTRLAGKRCQHPEETRTHRDPPG